MNLTELSESNKYQARRALKEHYDVDTDLAKLDLRTTKNMLVRVRGLLGEARKTRAVHESHKNPAYLKLVMMESMLGAHFNDLYREAEIILENEEVDKSQVILAAQDMVDSLQKMLEQISKMNVEELPAVVSGIESEIDSSQSQSFNDTVGGALSTLQGAIQQAKGAVQGALGQITGAGGPTEDFGAEAGPELGGEEFGAAEEEFGAPDEEFGAEDLTAELPAEPEEEVGGAGRGLR